MRGIIYKRTCRITSKVYIGQTINLEKRNKDWNNLKIPYTVKNSKIDIARETYGINSFDFEIVLELNSDNKKDLIEKLNEKEIYFIKVYDSYKNGLNSTEGGYSIFTSGIEIVQLTLNGDLIKEWDSPICVTRELGYDNSQIVKCCKNKSKSYKGFIWMYKNYYTDKTLLNQSVELANSKKRYTKPKEDTRTIQFDKSGNIVNIFSNTGEAGRANNINSNGISRVCSGERKSYKGFIWKYYYNLTNAELKLLAALNKPIPDINNVQYFRVIQCDIDGNFIKEWKNSVDASNLLGINSDNITRCCRGEAKTAGGFRWFYKNNYNPSNIKPIHREKRIVAKDIRVIQFSLSGEIIGVFNSPKDAANLTSYLVGGISKACKGRVKTYKGFVWKYYNNLSNNEIINLNNFG